MDIHDYEDSRADLLPLFALADDSPSQIARYLKRGDVLVAREGGRLVGHVQIVAHSLPKVFEIKSLAVVQDRRAQGIGSGLLDRALDRCHEREGRRVIVATAAADTANLRFYQRRGFRLYRVVRDAFGPETGYPAGARIDGIPLRDQLVLDRDL